MPKIKFIPNLKEADFKESTKILKAGIKLETGIRYGCGSSRCGQCAVRITEGQESLSEMRDTERELLIELNLDASGKIRLACQAKVSDKDLVVDLSFQDEYDPDA